MTPAPQVEVGWLEWALGLLMPCVLAVLGWFHVRLNRSEDKMQADNGRLWEALKEADRDFQAHRGVVLGSMITKEDLAAMESRIMAALDRSTGARVR